MLSSHFRRWKKSVFFCIPIISVYSGNVDQVNQARLFLCHSYSECPFTTTVFCCLNWQPAGNKPVCLTFGCALIPKVFCCMNIRIWMVGLTDVLESPAVTSPSVLKALPPSFLPLIFSLFSISARLFFCPSHQVKRKRKDLHCWIKLGNHLTCTTRSAVFFHKC